MDSHQGNIDNRTVVGQLFKAAFGTMPVYLTIPLGKTAQPDLSGYAPTIDESYYNKFEEMHLTPGKSTVVNAPLIEESPLCIECRVKEIMSLGSHDMFIADILNVLADEKYLDPETGKWDLALSNPLVYLHGGYYHLGDKIGKFGWNKKKKKNK